MKISKFTSLSTIMLAGLVCGSSAMAAQSEAGTGPNPFSDCGIGAALFPTVNWAAVSSNVIWDVGTTALTSATASPETCQGKDVKAAAFILETYDILAEETARGEGEYFDTLMNILAVDNSKQEQILASVRSDMAVILGDAAYVSASKTAKAESLYFAVMAAING